jgi:hypothetical protein
MICGARDLGQNYGQEARKNIIFCISCSQSVKPNAFNPAVAAAL